MWKILATSERYEIPNVASRSSVGINPKQLQMSMPIEPERRQFLWYFLYLCWDRPIILWNSRYLEALITDLRNNGVVIPNDIIKHIAPLGSGHVGPNYAKVPNPP